MRLSRVVREEGGAPGPSAASSFGPQAALTAPAPQPSLPPAVQLAMQEEFQARFGGPPKDQAEVVAQFGKSLLDEYDASGDSKASVLIRLIRAAAARC